MPADALQITPARVPGEVLFHEDALLRAAIEMLPECIVICDPHGHVQWINPAMRAFLGIQPGAWLPLRSSDFGDVYAPDETPLAPADMPLARALSGETVSDLVLLVEPHGGVRRSMSVSARGLLDDDGALLGAMASWRDVTETLQLEAFQRLHDPLTGLPNRRLFVDRVTRALARARRHGWSTAVLAVNVDRFADIANRLGDDAGSCLLAEVARRLEALVRPSDSVLQPGYTAARLGGDQFLVLCEHVADARAADLVATRIAAALAVPITVGDAGVSLTAGIGITLTDDPDQDTDTLILEAETALHRAKRRGNGRRETFAHEMREQLHARMDNEDALREALVNGEFRLAYQPKVSLLTGRIVGAEALLRWHHPTRGVVPPLDFIPLAEESGLIIPIGAWVVEQACRDALRWATALPGARPLPVSVNVSPRQFQSGLLEALGSTMAEAGVEASSLCVEVTEGMVMQDAEFAIATLETLRSLGLRVSMDDFGTGFSSLAYLKRFPLDELKIDKSFVDGLGRAPVDTAIVAAVMGMAHALDIRVVAEGVETADQASRLRVLGCDEAQGYHYAKPGPAEAIDELLRVESRREQDPDGAVISGARAQRVLIVDDAAEVRQLLRASLSSVGYHVREAGSGEEALALVRDFEPGCVVLDVNLPGISGLDVCRILRRDPAQEDTTIVMVTGDAEPFEKVEAFSLSADDYIVKPFSPRDLVARLTTAVARRAAGGRALS